MRRKYMLIAAVALILLLVSLCACAGGGQPETSAPPPAPPTQSNLPPVSQEASPDTSQTPAQQSADTGASSPPVTPVTASGEIVVTFNYQKQSGSASNQFAVWVEDMDGNYVNTIYATKWTAGGGYNSRPDSIAMWVEKSGIASMPDYYVDAISGATPGTSGSQSCAWNLKDINGDTVPPGEYRVIFEGTLRWKNRVIYSGVVMIGDAPVTIQADAEFIYEGSDRQAALTTNSPENAMIGAVTVSFVRPPPATDAAAESSST